MPQDRIAVRHRVDRDRLGELGFAGSLVGQRQKVDRHLAGASVVTVLPQGLEQTFVSRAREELVAIDEVDERHRLAPQGMDDMPIIDDMPALALRHRPTPP